MISPTVIHAAARHRGRTACTGSSVLCKETKVLVDIEGSAVALYSSGHVCGVGRAGIRLSIVAESDTRVIL